MVVSVTRGSKLNLVAALDGRIAPEDAIPQHGPPPAVIERPAIGILAIVVGHRAVGERGRAVGDSDHRPFRRLVPIKQTVEE